MDDRIGQQLGSYRLLRVLGQGAQARVYLGEHQYLERPAAIKVLHTRLAPDRHEAFRREARTVASLDHPHIIGVYDFGIQDETPYLVMPYSPHGSLRSRHQRGIPLSFEQIITYITPIASALHYAHGQHVVHRDIKPENLLLNAKHEVVLSDFGIAVVAPSLDSLSTQDPAGTPLYMAPEQIRGKPCPASDQYALAIMVYEWITGEPPFCGSLYEVFDQHLHQSPPSLCARLPQLPPAVEDAILAALAKDPRERFSTVQDFATVLCETFMATQPLPLLQSTQDRTTDDPRQLLVQASTLTRGASNSDHDPQPHPLTMQHEDEQPRSRLSSPPTMQSAASNKASPQLSRTNRERLLRRVRSFWITGVLERSLHGAALMALGLAAQPDAVANPWHLVLQHPDTAPQPLPAGTPITQVYDDADGELLILGAPGSGKTTLLLELARHLLDRAEHDEQHPMPVVLNLSSWAIKQQPFMDWLVEELNTKYQVPRKLGQRLVDDDQVLPLLDGLDEVAAKSRMACIEAINNYRKVHGFLPLVICSRSVDYLAQTTRVRLRSAVMIQPLTQGQVDEYLINAGEPVWALRVALHQDATLRELTSTPLMLSIMTLTYHGKPVENLLRETSLSDRQRQIFTHYAEHMLMRRGAEIRYTHQQTVHWLSWMAKHLRQQDQTVFYIERMQPDCLLENGMNQRFTGTIAGLIFGLVATLAFGLFAGAGVRASFWMAGVFWWYWGPPLFGLFFGLMAGGLVGLLNGFLTVRDMQERSALRQSWRHIWLSRTLGALLNGLLVGLLTGLSNGLMAELQGGDGFGAGFSLSVISALIGGSGFVLIDLLFRKKIREIQPTETLVWSWVHTAKKTIRFLLLTTVGCFLLLLLSEIFNSFYNWAIGRAENALTYWLERFPSIWESELRFIPFIILLSGFLGVLTGGLSGDTLDECNLITPNQGIYRSVRHSLLIGLGGGLVGGLVISGAFTLFGSRFVPIDWRLLWNVVLPFGGIGALFVGLISGLWAGGVACIQHFLLRWLLWRAGLIPWNYPRFLEHAVKQLLLQRVGGGYIFVHRLLLEHFANTIQMQESIAPKQEATLTAPLSLPDNLLAVKQRTIRQRVLRRAVLAGLAGSGVLAASGGFLWWLLTPRPLFIYRGHSSLVLAVAWSPDGKQIASASWEAIVQIWNPENGDQISTFHGHYKSEKGPPWGAVNAVAWSPDGKRIASGNDDDTVQVWDAPTGNHGFLYLGHSQTRAELSPLGVNAVVWEPSGTLIASASDDGTVQVWNARTGANRSTYRGHASGVLALAWSPDGKRIVSAGNDQTVQMWDVVDARHVYTYRRHSSSVLAVGWSPDGKHIASCSADKTVQVWNAADGGHLFTYQGHSDSVRTLMWSPDSMSIVSGGGTKALVWQALDGRLIFSCRVAGVIETVAWEPSGKRIATGDGYGLVQIWQIA